MIIEFLGGANEIGREAFLVESQNTTILLEYGVKLHPELEIPLLPAKKLDAVFVSHAHLDHAGMVPLIYKTQSPKLYATQLTLELMNLLLEDYIKVAKLTRGFSEYNSYDIAKMNKHFRACTYNKKFRIKDFEAELFDAFHIPGSASIYLANSRRILYTGDICMHASNLLKYRQIKYPKIDCLIIESTYSEREHPDREEEERKFVEKVREYSDGIVLIPTFAVGRAQEVLLILNKYGITKNVYLDGIAQRASNIILYHKRYIRDYKALKNILMKVKFVKTRKQRDKILKSRGVVVTTSGMLNGGPVVYYLKKIRNRKDSCLLFTGFQVEGTPGEKLLKTKIFESEDEKFKVSIEIKKFDFSAHAGRSELFNLVEKIKPEKVICVHGDHTRKFAREIEEKFGIEAIAPKINDRVEV